MIRDMNAALATPILYEYYCRFKGKTFTIILTELPIKAKVQFEPGLVDGDALVDLRNYTIQLPATNSQHKLYFLACHELAHIILKLNDFVHIIIGQGYWIQEAWCDNFALALTLAHFGIEVISQSENKETFFSIGVGARDKDSRNAVVAQQIKTLCHDLETSPQLIQFCESFI